VDVTVTCVEDDPVAVDDSATKAEDSGATAIDVLANDTDVDGGSKTIESVTQPANGTVAITNSGADLTYEPDANYCNDQPGTDPDTFTYTLSPGGSTATVSVKVTCVDDPPVAVNDSATVLEDAAATNVSVLTNDTDIDGGPKTISTASDPANGTVVVTGGGSGLTYKPDPNYCNDPGDAPDDTFTYTLNGGSQGTVSMKVTCVNDAPTAGNETFNGAIHNTSFVVDDPSDAAPNVSGAKKSITGDVLSNDSDIETPGSISVVANTNITSTNGGKVAIESDGDFTYISDPADNCSPNSDTFNYTITDNDPGGSQTAQGTVTINLSGCVWYVDNDPAETGNAGTSADPFDALSSADAKSVANQTVFVHKGTSNYTGGFNLNANERLIGEAVNLVVGGDTLFTGTPANRPSLSGSVNLNAGNTISGLAIAGSGTPAISGGSGDNSGTIADVTLSGGSGGLDLNTTSGTWNLSDLTVNTTGGDAIRAATAGTVNFTGAGTISVTAAAGRGLNLSGTATSGVIDNTTVTSSANEGIRIDDDTGSLTLDDVNLTTTGTGLDIDSSNDVTVNSSGDADISSAGRALSLTTATSNPSNMPDVTLDQVSSTGGATGINIDDIGAGTFSANGGTLSGHSGAEVDVNNGSGNVTYPGTIGNGSGLSIQITGRSGGTIALAGNINDSSDAGGGIDMSSNSGGTVTFSGATKTLNTGASAAFSSTGSNPTINFTNGGLDIDTTSGAGLSATGGGTITVATGANPNTIDSTTTGTALTVANTTIGVGGATFQRISSGNNTPSASDDPANGIVLNNTGSSGGLTVTGNAGTCTMATQTCTGGTIQNTTGDGIALDNTKNVSLSFTRVLNAGRQGLFGRNIDGFTLKNSLNIGAGDGDEESAILFENDATTSSVNHTGTALNGTFLIQDTVIDSPTQWGLKAHQASGTMNMTVQRLTVQNNYPGTFGEQAMSIRTEAGTSNVLVDDSDFLTVNAGVDGGANGTGTLNMTVQNSTVNQSQALPFGINFVTGGSSTGRLKATGNTLIGCTGTVPTKMCSLGIDLDASISSTLDATITNNTISNTGIGGGIEFIVNENALGRATISNNNITVSPSRIGMNFLSRTVVPGVNQTGQLHLTLTGNTVSGIDTAFIPAFAFAAGASGQANANTVCANLDTPAAGGNIVNGTSATDVYAYTFRMRTGTTFQLQGLTGSGTDRTNVMNFVNSNHGGGTLAQSVGGDSGISSYSDVFAPGGSAPGATIINYTNATCQTPSTPTLP
jgi:hypothetical protein